MLQALANDAVQAGAVHSLVSAAFDPQWNLAHRGLIWSAIFVVLFVSGVGFPLPEDVPLCIAGFSTFKQAHDEFHLHYYVLTFLFVVIPILSGDLIAYHLGKRYGLDLRHRVPLLRRALSNARVARVHHWFERYGSFAVFLGRQVAGVRFVTFFMAGTMRVPLERFVLFDFLGCLVSVPVWLTLGTLASRYGQVWLHLAMRKVGAGFLLGTVALVLVFFVVIKLRQRRSPHPEESEG